MACHCEPGVLQPGEAISYPVRGLPRREKTAARNDISNFKKTLTRAPAHLPFLRLILIKYRHVSTMV
jgi:hypothetical protein